MYEENNPETENSNGRSTSENPNNGTESLTKRNNRAVQKSKFIWELSQISTPKKGDWYDDNRIRETVKKDEVNGIREDFIYYDYYYDTSSGEGQYIYLAEDGIWDSHPVSFGSLFQPLLSISTELRFPFQEFQGALIEHVPGGTYADQGTIPVSWDFKADLEHGSACGAKVIGRNMGIVKSATLVVLDKNMDENGLTSVTKKFRVEEKILESLLNAANDIATKDREGKSVVSLSYGSRYSKRPPQFFAIMRKS